MQTSDAPLKFLGPQWFAIVMGWGGLGLAWLRMGSVGNVQGARSVAVWVAAVAIAVFSILTVLSLIRIARYRAAVAEDLAHPVRHAFVGAFAVSTIVISALLTALWPDGGVGRPIFMVGALLQGAVTVWVVSGWFRLGFRWPAATPILMIPIVGNVLVPLAGVPLGFQKLSLCYLALGMLMWPVVLTLVLARTAVLPMPDRLMPSWFITVAPPAVSGIALSMVGAPVWALYAMAGLAAFFMLCSLTIVPRLRKLEFGMPFWAMSFPSAAISAIVSALALVVPEATVVAYVLIGLVTALILWLSLMTLRGLIAGSLLVAEPVPSTPARDGAGSSSGGS
jgi:tellurite resistance protein